METYQTVISGWLFPGAFEEVGAHSVQQPNPMKN
jgi:hypothetical protein